jgi:hypothetical protein
MPSSTKGLVKSQRGFQRESKKSQRVKGINFYQSQKKIDLPQPSFFGQSSSYKYIVKMFAQVTQPINKEISVECFLFKGENKASPIVGVVYLPYHAFKRTAKQTRLIQKKREIVGGGLESVLKDTFTIQPAKWPMTWVQTPTGVRIANYAESNFGFESFPVFDNKKGREFMIEKNKAFEDNQIVELIPMIQHSMEYDFKGELVTSRKNVYDTDIDKATTEKLTNDSMTKLGGADITNIKHIWTTVFMTRRSLKLAEGVVMELDSGAGIQYDSEGIACGFKSKHIDVVKVSQKNPDNLKINPFVGKALEQRYAMKEEIIMKAMSPSRLEGLIEKYGFEAVMDE